MNYETYIEGLQIRINYLIDTIDSSELNELDNIQAEIKVLIHLKTTAQDEMHKAD